MNKLIYKSAILMLCLFVVSVSSYAANDEAQYKRINKEYTINQDGSYSLRVVKEITLYTHASFNSMYGESFIVYNPERETLQINKSYTTQADGTVIETPANAYNKVLPASAASAPAYNDLVEMVVTHTGLEIGATIYLDYTLTTKPAESGNTFFDIREVIEESSPIKEYTISIAAPESAGLRYELIGSSVKPKVNGDVSVFTFKNVQPSSVESYKPANATAPVLLATTMPADFIAKKYSVSSSCEAIKELSGSLVANGAEDEKAKSLISYVRERVAYSQLPFILQDNTERCLKTVVASGYATKMEKVALLKALLESAGVSHDIILVYPANVSDDMLAYSALKDVLFKIGDEYQSVTSPVDITSRASLDSFYVVKDGAVAKLDIESRKSTSTTHTSKITKDMESEGGYIVYTPEHIASGVRNWNLKSLPTSRIAPLELPYKADESTVWSLELEDGIELESAGFTISRSESFGKLSISLEQEGNTVTLKRSISFNTQTISPKEYSKFREFITVWNSSKGASLLFEVE